eukprot:ANDGO_00968.mRNA.1 Peptidyl-prolyl isomerase cwc27
MSLYPPTTGSVLLHTPAGPILIHLWCRECPRTCRAFIQLVLEGYYRKSESKVKALQAGFPVRFQEYDPALYARCSSSRPTGLRVAPPEYHSRLRFLHRGIVGLSDCDANNLDFFITLDRADQLQGNHVAFGMIEQDHIHNVTQMNRIVKGDKGTFVPVESAEVVSHPFDDLLSTIRSTPPWVEQDREREAEELSKCKDSLDRSRLLQVTASRKGLRIGAVAARKANNEKGRYGEQVEEKEEEEEEEEVFDLKKSAAGSRVVVFARQFSPSETRVVDQVPSQQQERHPVSVSMSASVSESPVKDARAVLEVAEPLPKKFRATTDAAAIWKLGSRERHKDADTLRKLEQFSKRLPETLGRGSQTAGPIEDVPDAFMKIPTSAKDFKPVYSGISIDDLEVIDSK